MTQPPTYKAIIRIDIGPEPTHSFGSHAANVAYASASVDRFLLLSRAKSDLRRKAAMEQINNPHYLNCYIDVEDNMVMGTFVFSDRNAALMFKLSQR